MMCKIMNSKKLMCQNTKSTKSQKSILHYSIDYEEKKLLNMAKNYKMLFALSKPVKCFLGFTKQGRTS